MISVVDETRVKACDMVRSGDSQQVVAIVGDHDQLVCERLVTQMGNGSDLNILKLDNKYYSAAVGVRRFRNASEIAKWDKQNKSEVEIGALIMRFSTKSELDAIEENLHLYQCDVQALVVDDETTSKNVDTAIKWAASNEVEVVFLNPDQLNQDEAASYQEKCGIARLAQMLHNVMWPFKINKLNSVTGKEAVDRLVHIIESMSDASDDSDWAPDKDDQEAIWKAFTSCAMPPFSRMSSTAHQSATMDSGVCDDSTTNISLDVVLNRVNKVEEAGEPLGDDRSSAKKKKKKNNWKSKTSESEEVKSMEDIAQTADELKELVEFDGLISSVESGSMDMTMLNIRQMRDHISKLSFEDKSRMQKAEAIVKSIAEVLGNDLSSRRDESDSE